ncbi:hypothetical protein FRC05_000683 [Tulasnella sp. 425]|nr:hypothetical protein FRC05_000683 [Tulasnella sp. 425]
MTSIFNYLTTELLGKRMEGSRSAMFVILEIQQRQRSLTESLTQLSIRSSNSSPQNSGPSPSDALIPLASRDVELHGLNEPPIYRVPEDVLLCIPHGVVFPPYPGPGRHLATLSLVCKHWREILESASTLWTYLSAVDGLPHVRNALRHTGQAPLDIVYHGDARCEADAFLLLVKDKIRYWRTMDISNPESPDVLSDLQTSKMPLLETLRISYRYGSTPVIDPFGELSVPSKLTELRIQRFSVTIPLWLANLTSLSLEEVLKLEEVFELEPNETIPHIAHLPSLISLDLWLPVAVIHYLLSGLRTNLLSRLHLSCDMNGVPPRSNLLSNRITHFIPTIRELVYRATRIEFEFDASGVYSVDLGDLNFVFDVEPVHDQYHSARDVFEWLAEHLGPDFREIPARLRFEDNNPFVDHLELYGSFPKPKVVEILLYEFDRSGGPPISVLRPTTTLRSTLGQIGPGLQALEGDPGISSNAVDIPLGIRWPPHVRNALRRTAQAPLDIVYHGNARCKADAFLLLVKDKIRYWRTVDLSLSGSSEVLSDIQTSRMPLLETFKISYRIQRHGPAIDLFGEPNVSSKLTELGIQGLSVAIPLWLANLTSLSLEAVSHVTIEEVLRVLQNSTGLKVLKLKQLFTPEPNEAIPHITHLPSLRSLDLWLPVAVIHYLLSGLRIDLLSRLHLSCDMDGVPLRGNLLSNRITHFIPTIRELVCRAARIEFEFEASGVYSVGLGDLNLIFDAEPAHDQYHSARDVFEWLAEHLGPDLRAIPARLRFEDHDPFVEHLELYGSFPNPRVVEIILCEFDPFDGTPISVLRYLGSPRQSDPSQWPFPHLETINYRLDKSQNRYLVEMLRSRYGDPKQIQQTTLQPPQPLKEIRIYEVNGVDVTQTDTSFLKEVQDLAAGAKIFWQDQVVTFA